MASNFAFQQAALTHPPTACFYSRRMLELAVV